MFSPRNSINPYKQMVKFACTTFAAAFGVFLAIAAVSLSAVAQGYDFCEGGVLDQGSQGQPRDLIILPGMTCKVDGTKKPYYFRNVYVFGDATTDPAKTATLVFSNVTMDFYAANILVQNLGVLQATGIGANNDGNVLTIHLYGSATADGITCKKIDSNNGSVANDVMCGVPTAVWGSNKMDMRYPKTPCTKTSQLNPPTLLPGGVDDCFYEYRMLDRKDLPNAYFGRKVLALSYGGTIQMSGYKGAQGGNDNDPSVTGSSWMRLNATLKGGEKSLQVSGIPADWKKNDYIVVTSTDYLPGHAEQLQVEGDVSDSTVKLIGKVMNPHWGQTYSLANVPCPPAGGPGCQFGPDLLPGQKPEDRNIDMRAAVGLLSRSIRIVSDGDTAGSPLPDCKTKPTDCYYGGHTVVRQGFLSYQIQGVEFYQLGQGGAIMHYPVHFHMARKTPANTYVKDSSTWDSMTRWITIHATQGVTLARNVGYKSIGHGFYLEDGTETDNVLNTNLGVFARAAVKNDQNDRKVPGILAEPEHPGADNPYHSDWEFPTLFWIMNGWNEFQYNFASSAGTCGVCYWLLPGGISGPSQYEWFEGYAGQQVVEPNFNRKDPGFIVNRAGLTPLKKFVGNSCSTAMTSFLNIGQTARCAGVSNMPMTLSLEAVDSVAPSKAEFAGADPYYPFVTGLRNPTQCTGTNCRCDPGVPGCNVPCAGFGEIGQANCVVTTLDRYTTSFNWAEKNFAAVWLRPWWFLVQNSAITNVQQGGLTFVTSGGYTRADVAQGAWSLLRKSALVGNTQLTPDGGQPVNPYASSAGPFNPNGLKSTMTPGQICDYGGPPGVDYCLSSVEGISYPVEFFSVNQKLFNIYDGPAVEEHNAYLDIPVTKVGRVADCVEKNGAQTCAEFKYLYGQEFGLTLDPPPASSGECYLPNAAIAWKQSNGFFYPPAFHSDNLFFNNVDIRHFVIEPEFKFGTFTTDPDAVKTRYCTWTETMFANFTDVDRQTVLNDDDASLTGLLADLGGGMTRETISVNEDTFFDAPTVDTECASDIHDNEPATGKPGTANTSPYEYITTATIAKCGINLAGCRMNLPGNVDCDKSNMNQYCAWGPACGFGSGDQACYGVPLYRQLLTDKEWAEFDGNRSGYHRPAIRMMGQGTGQRSTLTVNHGKYYIDDQVTLQTQMASGAKEWNIYFPNETYYTYLIYAKPSLDQTYQMFVGYELDKKTVEPSVKPYRAVLETQNYQFKSADSDLKFLDTSYDPSPQGMSPTAGLVTVRVSLSLTPESAKNYQDEFDNDRKDFCRPATYCEAQGSGKGTQCVCKPGTECTDNSVCAWAIKDIDCPLKGCFAFGITMPDKFMTGIAATPPVPGKFSADKSYNWSLPFDKVQNTNNPQCTYKK